MMKFEFDFRHRMTTNWHCLPRYQRRYRRHQQRLQLLHLQQLRQRLRLQLLL
jgi:hypothetical protein